MDYMQPREESLSFSRSKEKLSKHKRKDRKDQHNSNKGRADNPPTMSEFPKLYGCIRGHCHEKREGIRPDNLQASRRDETVDLNIFQWTACESGFPPPMCVFWGSSAW